MDEPVLKDLWDADVPASDAHFALAVMARIEQRRFRREITRTLALTAAAIALLAFIMPSMNFAWRESLLPHVGDLMILGLLGGAVFLVPQFWATRR